MSYPMVSTDQFVQSEYERMREQGESHNFAEMLATRSFPGIRTDSTWNAGRCNGNQFEDTPLRGDFYLEEAKKAGMNPVGMTYLPSLARFPGDPEAWVSGRGDVQRICDQRGWGMGDKDPQPRAPTPAMEVAPELIEDEVQDILASNPGSRYEDVHERVYQLRTGKVDPHAIDISGLNMDDAPNIQQE